VLSAIHVCPEAMANGPLALLRDGDMICVDAQTGLLQTSADLSAREPLPPPPPAHSLGRAYFQMWRNTVSSAEEGASHLFPTHNINRSTP